jgi:hypothetical protein
MAITATLLRLASILATRSGSADPIFVLANLVGTVVIVGTLWLVWLLSPAEKGKPVTLLIWSGALTFLLLLRLIPSPFFQPMGWILSNFSPRSIPPLLLTAALVAAGTGSWLALRGRPTKAFLALAPAVLSLAVSGIAALILAKSDAWTFFSGLSWLELWMPCVIAGAWCGALFDKLQPAPSPIPSGPPTAPPHPPPLVA